MKKPLRGEEGANPKKKAKKREKREREGKKNPQELRISP